MKDYHTWVADMANTIEDTSTFVRETSINMNTLTALQKRMMLADLLVPKANTEELVCDWVAAFCVVMDSKIYGKRSVTETFLSTIVAEEYALEFIDAEGDVANSMWLIKFKNDIITGKIK